MSRQSFPGFPNQGIQFLRSLKRNNNREWFQKNRDVYETCVKQPVHDLILALAQEFSRFAPEMAASPKISAYRLHRDTRFSKEARSTRSTDQHPRDRLPEFLRSALHG